jgi:hypothetical protein
MSDEPLGCAKPTGTVIGDTAPKGETSMHEEKQGDEVMVAARVGGKAPDFQAPAFHKGTFVNVKLSDYLGKWVLLCFYPGDFTFV